MVLAMGKRTLVHMPTAPTALAALGSLAFGAGVGLALMAGEASGTADLMGRLPVSSRFQCRICHTITAPAPGNAALNVFGVDFLANGSKWDAVLAARNSDTDGCSNGFELGDRDGNGVLDLGVTEEQSNPGVSNDCAVPISETTWGLIKKLFDG